MDAREILDGAIAKARRSLAAPKSVAHTRRREQRYRAFANAKGRSAGRAARVNIANMEAHRLGSMVNAHEAGDKGHYARLAGGMGQLGSVRHDLERARAKAKNAAQRRRADTKDKNHDGYTDGQKPKGAKPRKTGRKKDAKGAPSSFRAEMRPTPTVDEMTSETVNRNNSRGIVQRYPNRRAAERANAQAVRERQKIDAGLALIAGGKKPKNNLLTKLPPARGRTNADLAPNKVFGYGARDWRMNQEAADRLANDLERNGDSVRAALVRATPKHVKMIQDQTSDLAPSERDAVFEHYGLLDSHHKRSRKITKSAAVSERILKIGGAIMIDRLQVASRALQAMGR